MWTREQLTEDLKTSNLTIEFTKVDGTHRVMKCTLQDSIIKPYEKKTDRVKTVVDNVLSVWDLEKDSWRTVRIDAITQVYK